MPNDLSMYLPHGNSPRNLKSLKNDLLTTNYLHGLSKMRTRVDTLRQPFRLSLLKCEAAYLKANFSVEGSPDKNLGKYSFRNAEGNWCISADIGILQEYYCHTLLNCRYYLLYSSVCTVVYFFPGPSAYFAQRLLKSLKLIQIYLKIK